MAVSFETYERLALEDPDGKWELVCGRLRSKPGMTTRHNQLGMRIGAYLYLQVNADAFEIRVDSGRVRAVDGSGFIPDVMVVPAELVHRSRQETPAALEAYQEPLPLIVEIWSPSTGGHDEQVKLRAYQERGDEEIWLVHPAERSLRAFVRQPDGSYTEARYTTGEVRAARLPGVTIDLAALFR